MKLCLVEKHMNKYKNYLIDNTVRKKIHCEIIYLYIFISSLNFSSSKIYRCYMKLILGISVSRILELLSD